ncbi:Myb/SANT-like domain [Sesbania bispinosa]|nr:Myb/SANT-like domain [Sesbania bispinosa]
MGSQIPRGSDPSGTNWAPAMESYFISLLLDQVHRGNRMGYTFNKQAWNEMLALFNANFGSPHDVDVNLLKNRYTSLWMQFNDIKNLLDQNGFSWDETRQMVIASDHVWDAYIKAHPHAQAYRSKELVNIKDLCLIYAHKSADGRYSLSSHDMDSGDDDQVVNTGSGIAAQTPAPITREFPDTNWTAAMDCYFVKLMLDQLKNGNMIHNRFRRKAWNHMLKLFNKKFDAQYDKTFLKHRYIKLGNYYTEVKNLLGLKDFSWDEKQQKIVADDYVWDSCIKAHPHASYYRNKTLVDYRDLGLIYGNAMSNMQEDPILNIVRHIFDPRIGRENECRSDDDEYVGEGWTLHMDCYLTDLLLNQALKGSKTCHAFTYEAWCEIVTSFCVKFGSHYTKDALKNRHKYLKRKYNNLKVLIKQPGFAWHGTQEMVHPDALSCGNKFVPIYHKLCLIYGHEISEGRRGHSSCSRDHISNGPISTMGVDQNTQVCGIGDCLRTYWTPSMDRYLIDVMLGEIQRRNKIEYDLNDQAWSDMVVLFKERFGIQFDKNYLKQCCKGLEKLYHSLRSLLEQRGFSWDETQQVISACDGVWDAYIKENPDANSYRNHQKPNYNDLCLIYGNSDTEMTCNLANQNVGYNDYSIKFQNLNWRNDWTPQMDRYFIDLMLEEMRNGSMVDHNFNRFTWRDMVAKFSAEFGSQYDKDALKNRFMTLRNRFNDMKTLLNQNGFAWDEMRQMITADERLWDAYVKAYPDVNAYRNRTLPNFNDLFLIYEKTNCSRNEHYSGCSMDTDDNNELSTGIFLIFPHVVSCMAVSYVWVDNHSPPNDEPMRIAWTVKMNHYLIGLLLEHSNRGNKIGDTFIYKDVAYLLNQNGIVWDEIQHTSRANDVWQAYFEEYPEAIAFGETIRDNYSDLCLLFGNLNQNKIPGCVRIKLKASNNNNFGMETSEMMGDLQSSAREFEISYGRKRRKSQAVFTSSDARKVQKTLPSEVQEDLEEKKDNSIERIVAALQTVPDLDDELFLEACLLLEDERKAGMFVAMDSTARRRWLFKNLHQQYQFDC